MEDSQPQYVRGTCLRGPGCRYLHMDPQPSSWQHPCGDGSHAAPWPPPVKSRPPRPSKVQRGNGCNKSAYKSGDGRNAAPRPPPFKARPPRPSSAPRGNGCDKSAYESGDTGQASDNGSEKGNVGNDKDGDKGCDKVSQVRDMSIEVIVRQMSGASIRFNIPADWNIRKLKRHITEETQVPLKQQRLIRDHQLLKGGAVLSHLAKEAASLELTLVLEKEIAQQKERSPSMSSSTSSRYEADEVIREAELRGVSPSAIRPDLFKRRRVDWASPGTRIALRAEERG